MRLGDRTVLICDCGKTMALDGAGIARACGAEEAGTVHTTLCRREMARFARALDTNGRVDVACTQEAPAFSEIAEERGAADRVGFFNIRERAGWSDEGERATAKIAALVAEAAVDCPLPRSMTIRSEGLCLVYGRGQGALDAARRLSGALGVTCLLIDAEDALPPAAADFPIATGRIARLTGRLGAFALTVDRYAERDPTVRAGLGFGVPVDGAQSTCDVVVDLSGEPSPIPAPEKRDGYFRADPGDPAAVMSVLFDAAGMVGEFEKPLYVALDAGLCAHSRNRRTGCTRCLDVCPTGAIAPAGDSVAVDPGLCAGCGACAAACPTSAITYGYQEAEGVRRRIAALETAFRAAGGERPRLLIHDERHGGPLIEALARFGRGLPADVLPLQVNAVGQIGHDTLMAALALGFQEVVLLSDPARAEDDGGLQYQIGLADALITGLGDGGGRVRLLSEADPDAVGEQLYGARPAPLPAAPFAPIGSKRAVLRLATKGLAAALGAEADSVPLPEGAPYGRTVVDADGCTLCLSCVGVCPTGAFQDNPEKPQLLFQEDACVQCGLCVATCPEKVISLEPRYALSDAALSPALVVEDEPFACVSCGKPFGARRSVEAIVARLGGKHWMFGDSDRTRLIQMCEDCRVKAQFQSTDAPFAMGGPRRPRTTEDYVAAREAGRDLDEEE